MAKSEIRRNASTPDRRIGVSPVGRWPAVADRALSGVMS